MHLVCFKSPWPCRTSGEHRSPLAVVLLAAETDTAVVLGAAVVRA